MSQGSPATANASDSTSILPAVIAVEAGTFLLAAVLHVGITIPILSRLLKEPPILHAAIVESLCGALLLASLAATIKQVLLARRLTLTAHLVAIAGVILGIEALAHRLGPSTTLNFIYHRTIFVLLITVFVAVLVSPRGGLNVKNSELSK
jgi:hypothetical protein